MMEFLERLEKMEILPEKDVKTICSSVIDILLKEQNIVSVDSPVKICGDIHGQFHDLLYIFNALGSPKKEKYIFLGDYVDRGPNSVETYLTLLIYKILYPNNIFLIRGNHETTDIRKDLGFYAEIQAKYPGVYNAIYRYLSATFSFLLIGVVVNGRIFCVHGGISSHLSTLASIQAIDRTRKITDFGFNDIMWSDPCDTNGFGASVRGMGSLYGPDMIEIFLRNNDLKYLIRAHQFQRKGYMFHFNNKNVITIWSAPNYMEKFVNKGGVLVYKGMYDIEESDIFTFDKTYPKNENEEDITLMNNEKRTGKTEENINNEDFKIEINDK